MKTTYVYLIDENGANIPGIEPIEISVLIKGSTKNMALANGEDITEQDTTEPTVTESEVTETQVVTSEVEESPAMGNESTGVFGFGRAGKKTAQYANLHKNDIYNYYVVRSTSADILGKDNLLFVGQTSSDSMGSLSFEYETVTGEDGEIILKPMSDDPATPDTPSKPDDTDKPDTPTQPTTPTIPDNNGNTPPSVVVPVGGTTTKTMTVKVENKVTGKKSKAVAKKTGSTVTVKLGTENNGYYANVYTTDDEFVASVIIENGRAKFNAPDGVKLTVVIDKISCFEDVSSDAGASADSESVKNIPYPVIIILIAAFGIYVKVGKKYLDKKAKR